MFNEYETQYWGCRYMYIEKQWHQSIECNCTQKEGKNQTTTPTFNWKWRRFLPLFFHCRYDDRGSRSGSADEQKSFDTYWYIDKFTEDLVSDLHTSSPPVKPPLRTPPTIQCNTTNILNRSSVERRKWNRINPTIFFFLLRTDVQYWMIANWK